MEHLDIRDGVFKGLWAVNGQYAKGSGKWERIEDIIKAYTRLHPVEVELTVRENAVEAKQQLNAHASTKDKTLRWGLAIPAGLMFAIQNAYPETFSNKEDLHKFMRKFRGFTVCNTI